MPISIPLSPTLLQPLLPLREAFAGAWETILASTAAAPDPALAAAHLSRLAEHGVGSGLVIRTPPLCRDLLFLLGSSQHLTTVLLSQGQRWEEAFLQDRQSSLKSVDSHLSRLQGQLSVELPEEDFLRGLRAYRNREYLRIGTRDLLALATLEETTQDLSYLAEAAVQVAYEYTRAKLRAAYGEAVIDDTGQPRPLGFVVFAMGKFGGLELNFSSDIDLLYLYERDAGPTTGGSKGTLEPRAFFTQLAQGLTRALNDLVAGGRVFRVDLRLRPDGMNGPVVNSLPNVLGYYESLGQTWERVALLKARAVAGDKKLGEHFLHDISPFVFRRYLDFATLEDMKDMKARVERALRSEERENLNVKLGRGGIREIEFVTQALQLLHASKDPHVRERSTLPALDRLAEGKYLALTDRHALRDAYYFLRQVEHKLQIVQDRQTHTLPDNEAGIQTLARRLRLGEQESQVSSLKSQVSSLKSQVSSLKSQVPSPKSQVSSMDQSYQSPTPNPQPLDEVELFWSTLRFHTEGVHQIFRSLFHGAEKENESHDPEISALLRELHHEERTLWRLQQLGFRELGAAYQNVRLLHDGPPYAPASPKRRKLLYALAPVLFREVSRAADPDRALAAMASLIASIGARSSFLALLRENPAVLRTLVGLFGTSAYLTQIFLRHPELLDSLVRADLVRVDKDQVAMQEELTARLATVEEYEDRLDILRGYRAEEFLRIGIHDSNGLLNVTEVSRQLTSLAEVCLVGAYDTARAALLQQLGLTVMPGHLAIVGMGKLGAGELNYNSDLDLIFLYEAAEEAETRGKIGAQEFFTKLVQRLISVLQVQTREGYVYKIDTRLRPSGRSGSLVSSLTAFVRYHQTSSQLWERQALIKARVVTGDPLLKEPIAEVLESIVYAEEIDATGVAEIDRLRGRMEQELAREGRGRFNIKTGRGGLVDIEFLVQMLQLRYGRRYPALRQRATLAALEAVHACGVLPVDDFHLLRDGYRFLRTLENRLRIERDQPVEALESESEHLTSLARRLGYEGDDAATRLLTDYQDQREAIRACYTRWFVQERG
ncbi:MAG: bifunctional [glutamate--ammonia ligase]-adenylyl-L-tyrosine phosphorylase/[glutamate--ammonia-ligase] adenylyltransferase [Deltaproteobacteria bacterium]|nr:bifunctional [glutamate--ammonia ligase]-adenylyl-L-tyrosine phosphorylase/[glutamate--ammonia-ligase] adenylyltransferase [Deltaproteobacteria bacterium]